MSISELITDLRWYCGIASNDAEHIRMHSHGDRGNAKIKPIQLFHRDTGKWGKIKLRCRAEKRSAFRHSVIDMSDMKDVGKR